MDFLHQQYHWNFLGKNIVFEVIVFFPSLKHQKRVFAVFGGGSGVSQSQTKTFPTRWIQKNPWKTFTPKLLDTLNVTTQDASQQSPPGWQLTFWVGESGSLKQKKMSFVIVTGWGGVDPIDTLLLWWLKGDSWDYWRSPHDEKGMSSQHCCREVASNLKILGPGAGFFSFGMLLGRVEPLVVTHHVQKMKSRNTQKIQIFSR